MKACAVGLADAVVEPENLLSDVAVKVEGFNRYIGATDAYINSDLNFHDSHRFNDRVISFADCRPRSISSRNP
jgi:hypothetical protein